MTVRPIEHALREHLPARLAALPADTPVLLALSGGADSRALLHLLAKEREKNPFPLFLAHVNHGIRGEEAERDRAFCASLAERYACRIFFLDVDLPALACESGRSLEEEGRRVRYEFFARVMRENAIPLLATAHHADDNLETVLFRFTRGTGLSGLSGIRPIRPFAEGSLVRPLLTVSRREIEDYCREEGLEYVTDSTNQEPLCDRNRIRGEVLPPLRSLRPSLTATSVRTLAALREDEALLCSLADDAFPKVRTPTGLSIARLSALPGPLSRRILSRFLTEEGFPSPTAVHLDAIRSLLSHPAENASLSLPGPVSVRIEQGELHLLSSPARPAQENAPLWEPFPLSTGEFSLPLDREGRFFAHVLIESGEKIHNSPTTQFTKFTLPSVILMKECRIRPRRDGDRILRGGMHRPLRRLWADAGVPARLREALPVLEDAEGILWAPLIGARDRAVEDGELCVTIHLPFPIPGGRD